MSERKRVEWIPFRKLQKINGNAKMYYGRGTGAGEFNCYHCSACLGVFLIAHFNLDDPDASPVYGWYIPKHVCRETGKTYTVGFSNTTSYDLMINVVPAGITLDDWNRAEKAHFAKRKV